MIVSENTSDGRIRHWSDANLKIRQIETGNVYDDAVDVVPVRYTYEETDVPVDPEEEIVEDKAEAYDILMGVSE